MTKLLGFSTMRFEALPILELMIGFYEQPRGVTRFKDYINMMTSNKSNHLDLPLPFFNPMAKDHVPQKLLELKALELELYLQKVCTMVNEELHVFANLPERTIRIAFSLADDLKGGWTNKYSTHFGNTFAPKGMLNYNFASPLFWTSEEYSIDLIQKRIEETLWRTVYHLRVGFPITLYQHLVFFFLIVKKLSTHTPSNTL